MKYLAVLMVAGSMLAGCGTMTPVTDQLRDAMSPESFEGTTTRPAAEAYSCALQQINQLGYEVVDGNQGVGFVRGRIRRGGAFDNLWTGRDLYDQLSVSVFEQNGGVTRIRVVASQGSISNPESTGSAQQPHDDTMRDAETILATCGAGA